jgi:hypothetical protein
MHNNYWRFETHTQLARGLLASFIIGAWLLALASTVPRIAAAQQQPPCCQNAGFNRKGHARTPEEDDHTHAAANAAAAKATADSIRADCARRKQNLTDKLNALGAAWVKAIVDDDQQLATALGREYLDALSNWGYLQNDCPGTGDPPPRPRVPTVPAGAHSSSGGSPGSGGEGGGGGSSGGGAGSAGAGSGGAAGKSPADSAAQVMYEMVGLWARTSDSSAPQTGVLLPPLGDRLQRGLDSTLQTIASVRPASDYTQNANVASAVMLAVDARTSPADSATFALLGALQSEQASLGAFTQSYARFLGARDAHDVSAMLRQAFVMLGFADSALSYAHTAAARRHALFALAIAALDRIDAVRRERHRAWDEVIAARAGTTAPTDSTDAAKVLRAAGVPDSQIAAVVKSSTATKPPKAQSVIAAAHAEARADGAVQARLDSMRSNAVWPAPQDEARLDHARALALAVVLQADSAQMLASPDSSAPSSAPPTAAASGVRRNALWVAGFALLAVGAFGTGRIVRRRRANTG